MDSASGKEIEVKADERSNNASRSSGRESAKHGSSSSSLSKSNSSSRGGSRNSSRRSSKASSPVMPQFMYTKDELLKMRDVPLSNVWPLCLDPGFNKSQGRWDPERWIRFKSEAKRTTPAPITAQPQSAAGRLDKGLMEGEVKRSTRDPKERVKLEEQDGLVLSPQRRSFSTGCHGLQQTIAPQNVTRPDSPPEPPRLRVENHRVDLPDRRRMGVGSGRILRRDEHDPSGGDRERGGRREEKEGGGIMMEPPRRDWRNKPQETQRYERDDRYDQRRRYIDEEMDMKRGDRRGDRRLQPDRRRYNDANDQPEWFTEGPTSQNEFIELHGFDEMPNESSRGGKKKARPRKEKEGGSQKSSRSNTPVEKEIPKDNGKSRIISKQLPLVVEPADANVPGFNIDDFLEDLIGFPAEDGGSGGVGSSRMKQFFARGESPPLREGVSSGANSRRSSVEFPSHINSFLNELTGNQELIIRISSPGGDQHGNSRFFAPIAPAGNNVMDFLQKASSGQQQVHMVPQQMPGGAPSIKDLMMDGKGQSLEEIEAGLRSQSNSQPTENSATGNSAFYQFLSQVSKREAHQCSVGTKNAFAKFLNDGKMPKQPMVPNGPSENDIISMLTKGNMSGHSGTHQSVPPPIPPNFSVPPPSYHRQLAPPGGPSHQDIIMKLWQSQQKQHQMDPIKQLMGGSMNRLSVNPSPQPLQDQVLRDAILRPDVQILLKKIASGHLTAQQLLLQLNSGQLSVHERDAVTTVLKFLKGQQQNQPVMSHHRGALTPSPTLQGMMPGMSIGGGPSLSPRVASPNPDPCLLNPHLMQSVSRISPLMFASGAGNMGMGGGGNPRRPPSHQEMVAHTQSIMQKALLKQEMEKAKEKHRKRDAESGRSPIPGGLAMKEESAVKGSTSQSPLAFTPTSVMRKMTADKDRVERHDRTDCADNDREQVERMFFMAQAGSINSGSNQMFGGLGNKRMEKRGVSPLPPGGGPMGGAMMMGRMHSQCPPGMVGQRSHAHHNLNNIRAAQAQQQLNHQQTATSGATLQQLLFNNNSHHSAMPHHLKQGPDALLRVPMMHMGGGPGLSPRSSPVNLSHFFGRDVLAQAGSMPDLPGLNVVSLEELEKRQQSTQPVPY